MMNATIRKANVEVTNKLNGLCSKFIFCMQTET